MELKDYYALNLAVIPVVRVHLLQVLIYTRERYGIKGLLRHYGRETDRRSQDNQDRLSSTRP